MMLRGTDISIAKSRWMGPVRRARADKWTLVGQDGGQSIRCGDSVLFFFSDTLLVRTGKRPEPAGSTRPPVLVPADMHTVFLANCAGLSRHSEIDGAFATIRYFQDGDGLPREILPADTRERFRNLRFWPEHGILVDGRVYFYYLGIQTTNPESIWGFRVLGTGVAVLDPETGTCERAGYLGDWIFWRNETDDFHFGVHALIHGDWAYVFGSTRKGLQTEGLVARVRPERVMHRDAYQYLASDEPQWTADPAGAASLGPVASEYSVRYNEYLGKYTLFYVDGYSKALNLRVADRIWGPYTEPKPLFRIPSKQTSELIYLGFEHEAFRRDRGRSVFITCCEPYFSPASLLTITFERKSGQPPFGGRFDAE